MRCSLQGFLPVFEKINVRLKRLAVLKMALEAKYVNFVVMTNPWSEIKNLNSTISSTDLTTINQDINHMPDFG